MRSTADDNRLAHVDTIKRTFLQQMHEQVQYLAATACCGCLAPLTVRSHANPQGVLLHLSSVWPGCPDKATVFVFVFGFLAFVRCCGTVHCKSLPSAHLESRSRGVQHGHQCSGSAVPRSRLALTSWVYCPKARSIFLLKWALRSLMKSTSLSWWYFRRRLKLFRLSFLQSFHRG